MSQIKRTGDLRQFLADSILAVKEGGMDLQKAREITKLASQINESFYSEVKIAKTAKEMGQSSVPMGDLKIGVRE